MARRLALLALLAVLGGAAPGQAQLGLPGGGSLPGPIGGVMGGVGDLTRDSVGSVTRASADALARLREVRLGDLVRANPRDLEMDPRGQAAVRGEIIATAASVAFLDAARRQGFTVARSERLEALDLTVTTLAAPDGMSLGEARRRLAKLDPKAQLEFNHIYAGQGMADADARPAPQPTARSTPSPVRIGLVDTGVDARHPVFAGAGLDQRGFAPGGLVAGAHGTAVASLMTGRAGAFQGAAPGAKLYVADVFGPTPRGGSATAIADGLNWMGEVRPAAVNLSLAGPPNAVLQAAVLALQRRGVVVVASVSNDGPASPLAYPASYPGVISVIGVDGRNRALVETGRASHVDFAAPGADMAAASLGGGFAPVRGASFAAPIVTARLAVLSPPSPEALAAKAQKIGAAKTFGRGLVGAEVRTAMTALGGR